MRLIFFVGFCSSALLGCNSKPKSVGKIDPITGFDDSGIEPFRTYVFGPVLTGVVSKSVVEENVGQIITFTGLTSPTPRVSFSTSSGDSPMQVIFNNELEIGLQLNTGGSLDSFIIDKKKGLFARTWSGRIFAGASVGACK
jgi:hypothetical protein